MAIKWTRTHDAARQRLLEALADKVRAFKDNSAKARSARANLPFSDWCQTYLPHYFSEPFAPFHRTMFSAVGEEGMPTFIGAFRGAGKSVLLSLARPLWTALNGGCPYFIFGSRAQRLAAQNMDYIRLELDHNERIRADYDPSARRTADSGQGLKTDGAEEEWTVEISSPAASARKKNHSRARPCLKSIKFEAFGIGMSPRGRRHGQYRPLEFIGDDLEDAELARNPQREKHLWDWMMDEVVPALEPERWVFTVLSTMFGPGCMLEQARELAGKNDPKGRALGRLFLQPVTDARGHSVWPERFGDNALARVRAQIGLRNWMRNFTMVAEDPDKPFQPGWFREYDESDLADRSELDVVAFLDPALSESPKGCPRALIIVGCDRKTGIRYVRDAWIGRGTPNDMVEKIFEANERWRPRVFGIESNGGYALIKPLLESRAAGKSWVPARYVNHSLAKELRIEGLAPAMEAGRWRFPANPNAGIKILQDQFASYPDGFVDGPDAAAGCDELLPDSFRPASGQFEYRRGARRTNYAYV